MTKKIEMTDRIFRHDPNTETPMFNEYEKVEHWIKVGSGWYERTLVRGNLIREGWFDKIMRQG